MIDEVEGWIRKEQLIAQGDQVLVGVSGGADSVCLLLVLLALQERLDFSVQVLHVEHGIRGKESKEDALFVEKLCEMLQVPCQTVSVDVPQYATDHGLGLEEAARLLRYESFQKAVETLRKEEGKADCMVKIALAHHADDNAETVLFQMVRGSGIRGLGGIRMKRTFLERAEIIRPLLPVTRDEIEEFLAEQGQDFCIDATNLDIDYSRNRIRHEVIPQLKKVNKQALAHIFQSAQCLQELADYMEEQVQQQFLNVCKTEENGYLIGEEPLGKLPTVLQREMILHVLGKVAESRKDIGVIHVEAVQELFSLQVGRTIDLPYQMMAKRVYDGVYIFSGEKTGTEIEESYTVTAEMFSKLEKGEKLSIPLSDGKISLQIVDLSTEIPKKTYTKWLDYDKIKRGLQIRKRTAGDYLVIDEMGHRKKLKEYLITEKIPAEKRNILWLVAEASHVMWVVGGRISADCKITNHTKRILEIQITGGNYHEDQENQCTFNGGTD